MGNPFQEIDIDCAHMTVQILPQLRSTSWLASTLKKGGQDG